MLPGLPVLGQSADALYADRVDLTSARRAADLWSAAFDEKGIEAGRRAIAIEPNAKQLLGRLRA